MKFFFTQENSQKRIIHKKSHQMVAFLQSLSLPQHHCRAWLRQGRPRFAGTGGEITSGGNKTSARTRNLFSDVYLADQMFSLAIALDRFNRFHLLLTVQDGNFHFHHLFS